MSDNAREISMPTLVPHVSPARGIQIREASPKPAPGSATVKQHVVMFNALTYVLLMSFLLLLLLRCRCSCFCCIVFHFGGV